MIHEQKIFGSTFLLRFAIYNFIKEKLTYGAAHNHTEEVKAARSEESFLKKKLPEDRMMCEPAER